MFCNIKLTTEVLYPGYRRFQLWIFLCENKIHNLFLYKVTEIQYSRNTLENNVIYYVRNILIVAFAIVCYNFDYIITFCCFFYQNLTFLKINLFYHNHKLKFECQL